MATIKLILRESSVADGEGTLYFRIVHKRAMRQIHTDCHITPNEWDDNKCAIRIPEDNSRNDYLKSVMTRIADNVQRLRTIIADLERFNQDYTVAEIVERFLSSDTIVGFISYARKLIQDTCHSGKSTTAEHYASALSSFIRYHGEQEIPFNQLDQTLISGYECYLRNLNLCANTTSYYMRNLRSIYNHAAEQNLTEYRNPFKRVYTGVAKTVKRAVPIEVLKRLHRLDLGNDTQMELTRDLFIFSFYTRGMAFVDMAYLKKSDIKNGVLRYRRHKTSQQLVIKWEKSMRELAEKYSTDDSEYVFPLINDTDKDARRQYLNAYKSLSRRLRKLGELIGLSETLTFHRARHSWASAARRNNVPVSVIKEGMGHDSERTTMIYLESLDSGDLDYANSRIIGLLNK